MVKIAKTVHILSSNQNGGSNKQSQKTEDKRSWLTLLVVFLANWIMGITWVAFSVLYLYFTDYFNSTKSTTGWIVSIQDGVTQTFGVIVSPAVSMFGCRAAAITGSLLVSLSIFISSFTPNVWFLFVSFGFVPGIGLSMLYLSMSVVVQKQFQKNRALASGIAMLGLSVGNMTGPIITELLVLHYGWRGALMLLSGIFLHVTVLVLFIPPLHLEWERHIKNDHVKEDTHDLQSDDFQKGYEVKQKEASFLKHLLDFSVFKKPEFFLFCCSYMLLRFNSNSFWNHIVSRAVFYGGDQAKSAIVVSTVAVGAIVSRILCSFIANMQCSNYLLMYSCGLLLGALSTLAMTFTVSFAAMIVVAVVFGVHLGFSVTVVTVSAVYLLGVDKITRSQAFLNFFYGIAALTSVPFSGWVFDVTQNYNLPFYINGCMALFGSALGFVAFIIAVTRKPIVEEDMEEKGHIYSKSLLSKDKQFMGSTHIIFIDKNSDEQ